MIFMRENPFLGPFWKGWTLKIYAFLGPEMATSKASGIWAQKYKLQVH